MNGDDAPELGYCSQPRREPSSGGHRQGATVSVSGERATQSRGQGPHCQRWLLFNAAEAAALHSCSAR